MIAITDTQKKYGRWAGYVLFGLIAFLYAMHLTFPYGRIEKRLQEWAGDGFEVRVGGAGPGWFPGDVVLEDVTFKTRPSREGEKPVEFTFDRVDLDLGLLAGIRGVADVEFEAQVADGSISGEIHVAKSAAEIHIRSKGLPLENVPGIRTATGGVPMTGGLSLSINVDLPKRKWKEAQGEISVDCEACTIGDGVAKIRPQAPGQQNAFSEGGFTLPKLKLGKLGGKIVIAKGIGKFENFEGKSPDGELYLEGDIRFEDPFVKSQVTAYMRFKSSDKLHEREPVMVDIENLMKGQSLRPDGYMGVRITGPLATMRFLGSKTSPVPTKDKTVPGAATGLRPPGMGRAIDDGADTRPPQVNLPPPTAPMPEPPAAPPPDAVPVPPPQPPTTETNTPPPPSMMAPVEGVQMRQPAVPAQPPPDEPPQQPAPAPDQPVATPPPPSDDSGNNGGSGTLTPQYKQ